MRSQPSERINLSFMLTQGKIMQILNAALSEALHIEHSSDPAAAVTEWRQEAREDHSIHFKQRQILGQFHFYKFLCN